jgi:hypothetical protein
MLFIDLTNKVFGRLRVIRQVTKSKYGQSRWLCICSCKDEEITVSGAHLTNGQKSCGCLGIEKRVNRALIPRFRFEYNSYHAAKKRCNPKHAHIKNYKDWSGRGIEFRFKSFEEFLAEVGPRPEPKVDYSLDRIDNDGHYEKGNICWATKSQQARNRRCDNCLVLQQRIKELEHQLSSRFAVEPVTTFH